MSEETFPHGPIPKFSPRNRRHRKLFSGHDAVPYLLTTFTNAVWLEKRPEELDALLAPHQELILANVEDDDDLVGRTPDDEMERVEKLRPAYYIPSDRWVYENTMTDAEQLEEIDRCMSGTREVFNRIEARDDLPTQVIPIAKGWKRWHFERCRRTFEDLGLSYCAFDVTQYNSINMILDDVNRLVDVIGPSGILLIGRIAPDHLRRCPPEVVAATGVDHWRKNSQTASGGFSRERYRAWAAEAYAAIRSAQTRLEHFGNQSHVRIHG
ncbi:hypothetical protein G3I44_14155 [Halogeometricum borinquense]|uniref:Uncharacterized protein n=1 Tax=Halogeometricum borinquense TaxID=60847 RepID=A0A6C0UJF9_9EURY|nr:hypothetical protein [Halogeometricum borinquense]QIB75330.1 hypothetical protein G3I44_14155 [Halogeometricum borinquense]